MLLHDLTIDRLLSLKAYIFLSGVALLTLPRLGPFGKRAATLTGIALIGLGVFAMVFQRFRTEPGLWMLSGLALTVYGPGYIYLQVKSIAGIINDVQAKRVADQFVQFAELLDCTIALLVFGFIVRFFATVIVANWALSRGSPTDRDITR